MGTLNYNMLSLKYRKHRFGARWSLNSIFTRLQRLKFLKVKGETENGLHLQQTQIFGCV